LAENRKLCRAEYNAQVEPNGGENYVSFFDPATKGKMD
jgi:hypothetical protein